MIDAESLIYSRIATALSADFPNIFVTGEEIAAPPKFPVVSVVELDNNTYQGSLDNTLEEHHSTLMYQVDVYSNLPTGRKSQCREIMKAVNAEFIKLGFVRLSQSPMPNESPSVYRITARHRGIIDKTGRVYRR